jgi:hypothetical protein
VLARTAMSTQEVEMQERRTDEGMVMMITIGLMIVCTALMLTMITYALSETRFTGHERERGSAISVAEGQVDGMLRQITTASATALPCSSTVSDSTAPPETLTVTTTVTYYDAAGVVLACPVLTGTPATGLVRAVATSQSLSGTRPAPRIMEAVVRLTPPIFGANLTKAIFGDQAISMSNNADIYGSGGSADADLYTNQDFACQNNQRVRGSVATQGSLSMKNSCAISGNAWARTGFTASNAGNAVDGRVLVSAGNATLANGVSIGLDVQASGVITWNACPARCKAMTSVDPPPTEPFPQLSWDAATQQAWAINGYTNVVTNNNCTVSGGANGPGQWLIDNAATLTVPTILRTTCALVLQSGGTTVQVNNNIAVFADGGITLGSNVNLHSTTATTRSLFLVQPYNAVALPCSTDAITLNNQVTIDSTITMLLYSPCGIRKSNLSTFYGQIYSASGVTIDNQLTMYFTPLPAYGLTNGNGGGQTWKADLLSKRENS